LVDGTFQLWRILLQYLYLAVDGITLGSIYAFVALGFHLIYRTSGILDFAQGDKAVISGLIALSIINSHVPVLLALILTVLIGFVFGLIYELVIIRFTRRLGVVPAMIATVGAALILENGQQMIWGANAAPFPAITVGGFRTGGLYVQWQSVWTVGILAAITVALIWFLGRTRFGKAMVASAADPLAASTLGVSPSRVRMIAFGLAFALAAIGGVLMAPLTLAGAPIGASLTLWGFTGAMLGGLDSAVGVVVGSLALGLIGNLGGSFLPNGFQDPLDFTILLVILLFIPAGIFGLRRQRLA
jgi:branched-chain amino acid transport system permease protein